MAAANVLEPRAMELLTAWNKRMQTYAGLDDITKPWTEKPEAAKKFIWQIKKRNAWYDEITVHANRPEMSGKVLRMDFGDENITNSVPTDVIDRFTDAQAAQELLIYQLYAGESDYFLKYETINEWTIESDVLATALNEFSKNVEEAVTQSIANSQMKLGWVGVSRVTTHKPPFANMAPGWVQYIRAIKPEYIQSNGANVGQIRVGDVAGADFKNLHELASVMYETILEDYTQGVKAVMNKKMQNRTRSNLLNKVGDTPSELVMVEETIKELANLPISTPYYCPDRVLIIAPPKDFSLYFHKNWVRRVVDLTNKNGVMMYNSYSLGYAMQEIHSFRMAENIKFWINGAWA